MRPSLSSSRQAFTLVEIMIVVVIIGLLAAMAIPAFSRVRQSSQDKAVLNNIRQLAAAADQYFLESGISSCQQSELVGATSYVKALNLAAGEIYPAGFTQGAALTGRRGGRPAHDYLLAVTIRGCAGGLMKPRARQSCKPIGWVANLRPCIGPLTRVNRCAAMAP